MTTYSWRYHFVVSQMCTVHEPCKCVPCQPKDYKAFEYVNPTHHARQSYRQCYDTIRLAIQPSLVLLPSLGCIVERHGGYPSRAYLVFGSSLALPVPISGSHRICAVDVGAVCGRVLRSSVILVACVDVISHFSSKRIGNISRTGTYLVQYF